MLSWQLFGRSTFCWMIPTSLELKNEDEFVITLFASICVRTRTTYALRVKRGTHTHTHTHAITYRGETVEERLKRGVKRCELNRARMQNEGRR